MNRITTQQIKAIHVLKRKLGLDEETYREMLSGYGAFSSKDLSEESARTLISTMNAAANGNSVSGKYRPGKATPRQIRKIKAMWFERARSKNMSSLNAFIKRTTGIDNIEWLNVSDATKVINGLKKFKEAM